MRFVDARLVTVMCALYQVHQPEVAFVVGVCRPLGRGADVPEVVARVGSYVPYLNGRQGRVPARGVVCSAPPRMVDGHQPRALGVPVGQKVTVPGEEAGVNAPQEGSREGDISFAP